MLVRPIMGVHHKAKKKKKKTQEIWREICIYLPKKSAVRPLAKHNSLTVISVKSSSFRVFAKHDG